MNHPITTYRQIADKWNEILTSSHGQLRTPISAEVCCWMLLHASSIEQDDKTYRLRREHSEAIAKHLEFAKNGV